MKSSKTPSTITIWTLSLILSIFWSCGPANSDKESENEMVEEELSSSTSPGLDLLWETSPDLTTNESVHYEESDGQIYVANIEGGPDEKDGVGSISKLNTEGEILERDWVSGLNAPKGMAVKGDYLYVTDIDRLLEIELATGETSNTYEIDGAVFLNDAATDGEKVYFSDMRTNKIHYLEDGAIHTFAEEQNSINGLRVGNGNTLYGLDAEGLKQYEPDGSFQIINAEVTGGDGLIVLDESTFIASKWGGEVFLIQDGTATKILDTTEEESNTADIGFIPGEDIVLVPTFFKNKVVAYKLSY
ncbi:YncE family protein [Cyclobacterium plantarum]|uniref:ATP-binding protein n=1 Tax=Cyclobacterium plantarum TaxID=2716263 RepID=A0ABX0H4K6_9BACT|nr:ATP-binding protein [Cyclobacterium plantarum]NHE55207.1 ATP-binding protein [Cyclobacterium plantarum]